MIKAEYILYSYYIKYDRLLQMVSSTFKNSTAEEVNIYIDLYDMLYPLYNKEVEELSSEVIVSCVLNLCAHLRGYFNRTHHVYTKFYLVYSTNTGELQNKFITQGYDVKSKDMIAKNKIVNRIIGEAFEKIDLLTKYIDQIYFVNKTVLDPSVIIYDLILKEEASGNTNPNIIITKSNMAYQIPAMNKNSYIFRPYKKDRIDLSYVVQYSDSLFYFIKDTRKNLELNEDRVFYITKINPELLGLFISITGIPNKGVKAICNTSSTLTAFYNAIKDKQLLNNYNSYPVIVIPNIPNRKIQENVSAIYNRFKALDLVNLHQYYLSTGQNLDESYKVDLIDDNAVKMINNNYFRHYPIDLNNL